LWGIISSVRLVRAVICPMQPCAGPKYDYKIWPGCSALEEPLRPRAAGRRKPPFLLTGDFNIIPQAKIAAHRRDAWARRCVVSPDPVPAMAIACWRLGLTSRQFRAPHPTGPRHITAFWITKRARGNREQRHPPSISLLLSPAHRRTVCAHCQIAQERARRLKKPFQITFAVWVDLRSLIV